MPVFKTCRACVVNCMQRCIDDAVIASLQGPCQLNGEHSGLLSIYHYGIMSWQVWPKIFVSRNRSTIVVVPTRQRWSCPSCVRIRGIRGYLLPSARAGIFTGPSIQLGFIWSCHVGHYHSGKFSLFLWHLPDVAFTASYWPGRMSVGSFSASSCGHLPSITAACIFCFRYYTPPAFAR
jgi:hypothetical protein